MLDEGKQGRAKASEAATDLAVQRLTHLGANERALLADWPNRNKTTRATNWW